MFSGFFNYDNPVWRFIGKFFDIMILNVLWVICSLPIVTMGAATTAVYYVTLKLVRDEEGATIKSFFKSFKENFKQATVIWLIMLATGAVIAFDLFFFLRIFDGPSGLRTALAAVFMALGLIWCFVGMFVFPVQCRFINPVKKTFFNAFYMSIRHFPHTLGLIIIDVGLPALAILVIPILIPVFFLFGFRVV